MESLTGKLIYVEKEETVMIKGFPVIKTTFLIQRQDDGEYVCFEVWKERVESIKKVKVGTLLEVFFKIKSTKNNGIWYHTVRCWKWEVK